MVYVREYTRVRFADRNALPRISAVSRNKLLLDEPSNCEGRSKERPSYLRVI